jgi:hypothetical protein
MFLPQFPLRSNWGPRRNEMKMGLNKLSTNGTKIINIILSAAFTTGLVRLST